ncbi:TPA: iron-containing alcohol dehydrogenase [Candidatus Avigastranaerophilus faecigallinarum]|nr:iron-containing alcohol dehydrogenase [Candidatus Avigastranaerophilus faecigallinarum]
MWKNEVDINQVVELRLKPNVYFGFGAINKIEDVAKDMKSKGIDKILVVSGRNAYKSSGAWEVIEKALKNNGIAYTNYAEVTPNPTADAVDAAAKQGKEFGAKAVMGIGGGSPIDAAKSVAIMLANEGVTARDIYEFKFIPEKAVPIVAINLTHGTGTETNRFAVVTIPETEYKPAIAYDCIYPSYSIDDPALMMNLSPEQTIYVSIDAVNHSIEAATTKVASPYSISTAKECIELVAKYLPIINKDPQNKEARYFLLYASILGGVSFDNGLLHFTHALEHPLSGVKPKLSHGLGLAMILPAVVKYIYPAKAKTLASLFSTIIPDLKGTPDEAEYAAKKIEEWLFSVGITKKLTDEGFSEADVEKLVNLTFETPSLSGLISIAPVEGTKEVVKAIFTESLKAYN